MKRGDNIKKILILLTLTIFLVGCDNNKNENVTVSTDGGWYINTSESVSVTSYNKYRLVNSDKTNNKDGSVTVILKFDKPIK